MSLLDRAKLIQNQPEQQNDFSDLPPLRWFNTKAGDRNGDYMFGVFVVPFTPEGSDKQVEFVEQYKHYQLPIGYDGGKLILANRVCVEKTSPEAGLECPFCRVINSQLTQTQSEDKRKDILRLRAKLNAYANVLPVIAGNQKITYSQTEGDGLTPYLPHIIQVNQTVYDAIAKWLIQNEVFENPSVWPFDVWNSRQLQITIKRQGQRKMDVRYSATFGATTKAIVNMANGPEHAQAHMEYIYDNVYDLTKIFKLPNDEKLGEFEAEAAQFAQMLAAKSAAPAAGSPFGGATKRNVPPPPSNLMTPPAQAPVTTQEIAPVAPVAQEAPAAPQAAVPQAAPKKFSFGPPPGSNAPAVPPATPSFQKG
jgi:hypothetical protein